MAVLSIRIEDSFKAELELRSEESGLNQSEYVKRALENFMRNTPNLSENKGAFFLSKLERLTLVNQYRILQKIDPDSAADCDEKIAALQNGYELDYAWTVENFSKGLTTQECQFVLDVLSMYRDLKFSTMRHVVEDKNLHEEIDFQGFDGNGEAAYRGYVQYFINDLGRFEELRAEDFKKSFDSHSPMIDTYRLMLPVWQKIRTTNDAQRKDRLSLEQVKAIVFAPPWKKQPS